MSDLARALADNAVRFGQRTAFRDGAAALSWRVLAMRAAAGAEELGFFPETIGIAGRNGVDWAVAFLAASLAGKTIVPMPGFFSPAQQAALARDAGITRIILTGGETPPSPPVPAVVLTKGETPLSAARRYGDGGLVIYTSGSTGRPKGVRLQGGQPLLSAAALAEAAGAGANDRYLSLLPLPMLLEIICAIIIPVLVGGESVFAADVADGAVAGASLDLVTAFERARPTMTVMVPQLLALYARQLLETGKCPPASLRFAAVGGAMLAPAIAGMAEQAAIPFFEGYGLSECASVVALNRPGAARRATAGRPLPGVGVSIVNGEITVSGPTVMDGYLHGEAVAGHWPTGDLGEMDEDGFLRVLGRRDNLIVTPAGRNISPEWIETMLMSDPRITACVVLWSNSGAGLGALVILPPGAKTRDEAGLLEIAGQACAQAPAYARPAWVRAVPAGKAREYGLLAPDGSIRRAAAQQFIEPLKTGKNNDKS